MIGNVYSSKGNHMATMKTNPNMSMAELILASISKIIDSTACTEEHGDFIEIGSYFYRASMAIIELQAIDPIRFDEILQSLNKSINFAKDLLEKFLTGIQQASDSEPISIIDPLKELIKQMGECLNKVATYSFEDQNYVKMAILSLSDEMQNISSKIVTAQAIINEQEMRASSSEEQPEVIENDLYPIDMDWDTNNTQSPVESELSEAVKYRNVTEVSTKRPSTANYIEPLFETFICPLTKDIMDDPVSLETGVTYERKAIVEWFEEFEESEEVFCPVTGQKLVSKAVNSNRALKSTIDKWKERNEIATIKVARAALSLASSDAMVLEAIEDLSSISKGKQFNIERIFDFEMLPLLVECLLAQTSSDEVQKLSAIGLEKLSSASMSLSKPLDTKRKTVIKFLHIPKLLSLGSSKKGQLRVCPVHKGACSSQNTFCLVHAKAIERLLRCLDNEKEEVAEAALSAICTLVDDKVDVDRSVSLLNEFDTIKHVLNVVRMHEQESLWHKSFWLIEKFLLKGGEDSLSNISQDRSLPAILAAASHQGSSETRQIAEKILTHLNMVPNFSAPNQFVAPRNKLLAAFAKLV